MTKEVCFFCGKSSGTEDIHEAATFQINNRVWACATLLEDTKLLSQLSAGDMVALEAKHHTNCLVGCIIVQERSNLKDLRTQTRS